MNPKITIAVNSKNKAVSTLTGIVSVGALIDVEITGLPTTIPDWESTDDWTGRSLRFRVVDELGRDLVRFPLAKKTETTPDVWTCTQGASTDTYTATISFDTADLRQFFRGVPYSETLVFGLILDSTVDDAEYATGSLKVKQWAAASSDDPLIIPDWRETLVKINTGLSQISTQVTTATTAATTATTAATTASTAATTASTAATAAATSEANAAESEENAADSETAAALSASAAATSATNAAAAVANYPRISSSTGNWERYVDGAWVDSGVHAKGDKGDTGDAGADGEDGDDGFSPTVAITTITGGHTVTITDAAGAKAFNVMDGETPTNCATKPTTGGLATDSSLDDVIAKLNILITQLKS